MVLCATGSVYLYLLIQLKLIVLNTNLCKFVSIVFVWQVVSHHGRSYFLQTVLLDKTYKYQTSTGHNLNFEFVYNNNVYNLCYWISHSVPDNLVHRTIISPSDLINKWGNSR
jgi:hypothetical protein